MMNVGKDIATYAGGELELTEISARVYESQLAV
jgi:hypothetical protein